MTCPEGHENPPLWILLASVSHGPSKLSSMLVHVIHDSGLLNSQGGPPGDCGPWSQAWSHGPHEAHWDEERGGAEDDSNRCDARR